MELGDFFSDRENVVGVIDIPIPSKIAIFVDQYGERAGISIQHFVFLAVRKTLWA